MKSLTKGPHILRQNCVRKWMVEGGITMNEQDEEQYEVKRDALKIKLSNLPRTRHLKQLNFRYVNLCN